ncbi:MAG TPA: hypothetical protein VHS03_15225 [Gaiellaceae bacterium]|nr:hypothetical protein [Gaiellaceae bacterium]
MDHLSAYAPEVEAPEPSTEPTDHELTVPPAVLRLARAQVRELLESSRAYSEMPRDRRRQLAHDLVKVAAYTAALLQEEMQLTEQLDQIPVLVRQTLAPLAEAAAVPSAPRPTPLARAAAGPQQGPPPPSAEEWSPRAASQVAKVTRATLNAIEFPTFVADLIKGTYNAIIDASIKQMEAYAELLANVAKTVDQFMSDNITDNQARDYIVNQYPGHFKIDVSDDAPKLAVKDGAGDKPKPDFKTDLELPDDVDVSDESAEQTLVPAARRKLARQRQQLLSTMVMMGVNRIVVTSGRIRATMGFRIDAHDHATAQTASEFDEQNTTAASGWFGFGGAATVNTVTYVSSTKKDSSDDLNVQADLTGEVDLRFKSDYLPLERMATPQMIGAIQGNTPNPAANTPQTGGAGGSQQQHPAAAPAPAH